VLNCQLTICRSHFDNRPAVWDQRRVRWLKRDDCIWNGPDFIQYKSVLSPLYGNDNLLHKFFKTVLDLRDWKLEDVLQELELLRDNESSYPSMETTCSIYSFLNSNSHNEEDWIKIK
jgi:hypothetical protein